MPNPKICVFLGAGASYDVFNGFGAGYGDDDEFRMPLTSELFDVRFLRRLDQYPGARVLAQELGPLAQSGALNLEARLSEYRASSDERVQAHYTEVVAYIRDVIAGVSVHHHETPGTYTQLVKRLLSDQPHDVLFLTTNYDDLTERALAAFDPTFAFTQTDDYIRDDRPAIVVKLHGSVDWFVPLAPYRSMSSWRAAAHARVSTLWAGGLLVMGVNTVSDLQTIDVFHSDDDTDERGWLYPWMAAPEAGKGRFRCPETHVAAATDFIRDCEKFLIVGSAGLDSDVMELLDGDVEGDPIVHLVGGTDAYESAFRFYRGIEHFGELGGPGTVHSGGFRDYVASPAFMELLTA